MKQATTLILSIFFGLCGHGQNVKTYSGDMNDAMRTPGKVNYTYYEKEGQIIRHGKFSYAWSDKGTASPRGKSYSYAMTKSINGEFKDGRKHGLWTYVINFTDFPLGHSIFGVTGDILTTGNIKMTANYLNGLAHGAWNYDHSFKSRYLVPTFGSWNWSDYDKQKNIKVTAHFSSGKVIGNLIRQDSYSNVNLNLSFDENGFLDGVGTIEEDGNKRTTLARNGILVKEVITNMSGATSKVIQDNTEMLNDANAEYSQKIISLLENTFGTIAQTLVYFKQNKFFNYQDGIIVKEPLIGGDEILEEGFKGAYMVIIEPCKQFKSSYCGNYESSYEQAEKHLRFKEDLKAIEQYEKCIECLNAEWSGVCSDERKKFIAQIEQKISELKIKIQKLNEEKQAKENLVSLNNRTELLNAANPVFFYLIRNADRENVFLINLLKTVNLIEGRPYPDSRNTYKIQNILNFKEGAKVPSYKNSQGVQQYKQERLIKTQLTYLNGLVSNLENYPSFLNNSKVFYKNLFQEYLIADYVYLLEFSKMNSKYEELFAKNLSFEQMNSEANSLKKNWLSELEIINNDYLKTKASNILERFEFTAEDIDRSFSLFISSTIRKKYSNIFELLDQKISEFNDLNVQSKIVFLKEFEPLLDKLIKLDLSSINKELSKMKKSTINDKYDFIKN